MNICFLSNACRERYAEDDGQRDVADTEGSTTPRAKRTGPTTATEYMLTELPHFQDGRSSYCRPRIQLTMERKVDAEVGKAHDVRVTCRRHYVVGAIPGRQYYASPLSLPLTHPQPCRAWSMIMTWQQVEIMRGESPKSYVRVVRARPTSCGWPGGDHHQYEVPR